MASTLKAYSLPLILFTLSLFYQLIIIPRSYPTSHYDVLGIKRHSSVEEVTEAYEKLSSKWSSSVEVPHSIDIIKDGILQEEGIPNWQLQHVGSHSVTSV